MLTLRQVQLWKADKESRCSSVSEVPNSLWKYPGISSGLTRLLVQTIRRGCPHSRRRHQRGRESGQENTRTEYRRVELRWRSLRGRLSRIRLSLCHTVGST